MQELNDCQENRSARLRELARSGDAAKVQAILKTSPSAALATGPRQETALAEAAKMGHAACVRALLPHSDANQENDVGMTAIMWAAYSGNADCCRLLAPVSDCRKASPQGYVPLTWAATRGDIQMIEELLPYSDLEHKTSNGKSALACAAGAGKEKAVQRLLAQPGIAPLAVDDSGQTALMAAARHPACLELLLPVSDACALDGDGRGALAKALMAKSTPSARILLPAIPPAQLLEGSGGAPSAFTIAGGLGLCEPIGLMLEALPYSAMTKAAAAQALFAAIDRRRGHVVEQVVGMLDDLENPSRAHALGLAALISKNSRACPAIMGRMIELSPLSFARICSAAEQAAQERHPDQAALIRDLARVLAERQSIQSSSPALSAGASAPFRL